MDHGSDYTSDTDTTGCFGQRDIWPALTRYIKNLEEKLNVTLFDRSSLPSDSMPRERCKTVFERCK